MDTVYVSFHSLDVQDRVDIRCPLGGAIVHTMWLESLSDIETLYGEDARRSEVVPFVWRRPRPPAERRRRAAEHAYRGFDLICGGAEYGDPRPSEEEPRTFPRLVEPE